MTKSSTGMLSPVAGSVRQVGGNNVTGIDFLEEPIRDETPEAYESLRKLTEVPFAIGEEFASKWQFLPFIEGDLTQFNRIDICNVGGLTEATETLLCFVLMCLWPQHFAVFALGFGALSARSTSSTYARLPSKATA